MESSPVLTRTTPQRGFTLVEMLVVLAIISIITAIAVTGQSTFNKSLILTDTAYRVAFSARQAQSYGLASRKYGVSTSNPGYGLHFESGALNSYIFFADIANLLTPFPSNCPVGTPGTPSAKPGNCRFDSSSDGKVSTFTFDRGFSISSFCGKKGALYYCSSDVLNNLDVVFTRPNTSTTISGVVNGSALQSFDCAVVTITDQSHTANRTVRISSLGEISVGASLACP
jgi:prepilin-type N-terminal cleavage/methylation domain-containing protein